MTSPMEQLRRAIVEQVRLVAAGTEGPVVVRFGDPSRAQVLIDEFPPDTGPQAAYGAMVFGVARTEAEIPSGLRPTATAFIVPECQRAYVCFGAVGAVATVDLGPDPRDLSQHAAIVIGLRTLLVTMLQNQPGAHKRGGHTFPAPLTPATRLPGMPGVPGPAVIPHVWPSPPGPGSSPGPRR